MELIRPIVRVGNSAGVILPREWLNGEAKIELIARPVDVGKGVFDVLEGYLFDIIGLYVAGSYARGEQNSKSDVDILAITNKTNKSFDVGKYSILLISRENVEKSLQDNVLPILPMIKEAKVLINGNLIEEYKKTKLTRRNLDWHIEGTKSILKVNRAQMDLDGEESSNCSDAVAYSLVLRLREIYIVDCLRKNRLWSNRELLRLIRRITGSLISYQGYLRVKNDEKTKHKLPIEEAEKLYNYIYTKIREQEKWVKKEG